MDMRFWEVERVDGDRMAIRDRDWKLDAGTQQKTTIVKHADAAFIFAWLLVHFLYYSLLYIRGSQSTRTSVLRQPGGVGSCYRPPWYS